MISGIIAFCKACKIFHEYQDMEAHIVKVKLGDSVWEPLVIPVVINQMSLNIDVVKYTVLRLNKILEEVTVDRILKLKKENKI